MYSVLPYLWYEEQTPADVRLGSVTQWAFCEVGASKRNLRSIAEDPSRAATWLPTHVTCVEKDTPVRDCLSLMLGNGLLYVPVIEDDEDSVVDVISLKDITHFLARDPEA